MAKYFRFILPLFFVTKHVFGQPSNNEKVGIVSRLLSIGSSSKSANPLAVKRLQKELRNLQKSEGQKNDLFSVEVDEENIFKWVVKIKKAINQESPLAADMQTLAQPPYNQDHLLFHFIFNDKFPMEPPFVRLVSPVITGGHVMNGGAICTELLTPEGWASTYTVEAIIMQIAVTLTEGGKIEFDERSDKKYTLRKAKKSQKFIVKHQKKHGWGSYDNGR